MDTKDAREDTSAFSIRFDAQVYDLDTIKRAAYRFTDRCTFDFYIQTSEIVCNVSPRNGTSGNSSEVLAEFKNEILDQDLRRTIAEETAPIRNAVLAYAFSKTGLQASE